MHIGQAYVRPIAQFIHHAMEDRSCQVGVIKCPVKPLEGNPPKNILLIEGVVDGYFLPRMVNALAMAARLDLAGPVVDPDAPGEIGLAGGSAVDLPAGPNRAEVSGYVVQFEAVDFDGHYVPFELPAPKYTYKCWFDSLIETGSAVLPAAVNDGEAACP